MRILAIGITFCLVFYTACVSDQNDYDAGIAAYKRGHYEVAFSNFESRAIEGDPIAQFCLGFIYKHEGGVAVDKEKAVEWYERAASQDYAPAQNNLGVMYVRLYEESNHENLQAREKALEWFRKSADQGYLPAQNNLGVMDHMRLKWWEQAASQGYAPSQRHLGYMYHEGDGVKQNFTEAVKWHTKAAEQGDPFAEHNLGLCYKLGLGVKQDRKTAFSYFKKAAEQGYANGQFQVALAYMYGWGIDKNPEEAIKWYEKAAKQNHADAQNNLAALYSEGEVIPQDSEKASRWMLRAAQQGHPIAQANVATNFLTGRDEMPQDFAEAYYWYSLALKNKELLNDTLSGKSLVSSVTEDRERSGNQLDEAEKSEIQVQIDYWKPKILRGYGTGFYIDKNHILTKRSCCKKARTTMSSVSPTGA